jgi:hypothetical protein
MSAFDAGDRILVRGEVRQVGPNGDYLVEFFSKTDQWRGWIRPDLCTEAPYEPKFPLGAHVRFAGSPTESGMWADRREDKHLGIVIENFGDGDVRVYDTVEHDWWACDETRLAPFEDAS